MGCCNAYESESMREALGETLRPGGLLLTEQGVRFCGLSAGDRVLDLGCGRGATVRYLRDAHGIRAVGADPSEKLLEEAERLGADADFILAKGEDLPFEDGGFDAVFAECTLSLMDAERALAQVSRVLKDRGWFVVTDVYARRPDAVPGLRRFPLNSCMRGLHDLGALQKKLEQAGFRIALCEDRTGLLKELLVKITFSYGSMRAFWNVAAQNCVNGCDFYEALKSCRPGYFILIAGKGG